MHGTLDHAIGSIEGILSEWEEYWNHLKDWE